jgi:pimeloyl-ACP methyl ester carboxylesterase
MKTNTRGNKKLSATANLLHLTQAGVEDRPLVFLHGMASSGQLFALRCGALEKRHNVLYPDLLGFGFSPYPNDSNYEPSAHVEALHHTLQAKAPGQLANGLTLVAHSMGGLVALAYAARYPERVRQLIIFNPLTYWSPDEARRGMSQASTTARLILRYPRAAQTACLSLCSTGVLSHAGPHLLRRLPRDVAAALGRHSWISLSRTLHNLIIDYDLTDYAAQVKAHGTPVSLIYGQYDRFTTAEQQARLEAALPQASVQRLPSGHHPFHRRTDLCLEVLQAEMAKLPK